jgi:hypothetical protein
MRSNTHSSPTHKFSSFGLLAWLKVRLADVMVAAQVLTDIQMAAPWDERRK